MNTEKKDDIMKEREDYVNEKKKASMYLDDISEMETAQNRKERLSKKFKDKTLGEKE